MKSRLSWPLAAAFVVALVASLLLFPLAARAQTANWDFTLALSDLSGSPGSTLTYSGTIRNDTGGDLTITGVSLDFDTSPHADVFDLDFADEFVNTGLVLPAAGYAGPLFLLRWHPDAAPDLFGFGTVEAFADTPADPVSIPQAFTAHVLAGGPAPAVPEPGAAALLGALLLATFWLRPRAPGSERLR